MIRERIRAIRTKRGLSQEYIAEQLSLSQSTLARIEQGKARLDAGHLPKLCEVLETDLDELFTAEKISINQNTFTGNSSLYGYVAQLVNNQKELYEDQIKILKDEVTALRSQIKDMLGLLGNK